MPPIGLSFQQGYAMFSVSKFTLDDNRLHIKHRKASVEVAQGFKGDVEVLP